MTSISKDGYIDKLDDIVNIYNNANHSLIKMKPVEVKPSTYIDYSKEINDKDPKFKIDDIVRIPKYFFAKGYVANCSEEVFAIRKVKSTVLWTYVNSDFKGKEIAEIFYKKQLEKTNRKEFRVEKLIKRKDDKLYLKWKGYDNSFNS